LHEPQAPRGLKAAFRGAQLKPTVILLVTPVLLTTWKYFGSYQFYLENLAGRAGAWGDPTAAAATYSFLAALVLLGIVPALVVKLVFRERLADYGVGLGDRFRTVRSFLVLAPLLIAAAWLASRSPAMAAEYPINKSAASGPGAFASHALVYAAFYLGWEFYFRGFMQFGLRESLGDVSALLVQVACSVLLHIGKPATEVYAAIGGGILWGIFAFRTRSLLSGLLQHLVLGLALDWFLCFG